MKVARFVAVLPLLAVNVAFGQSQVPNLQGYVYDSHHIALEGATASAGASGKAPALTDNNGHFAIEILPSVKGGTPVTLRVQKDGFRPWTQHLGLSDVPVVVTLVPIKQTPGPGPTPPKPVPVPARATLWTPSDDIKIDSVQGRLNTLNRDATDAQISGVIRGLFDAPVFSYLGEELPEDALYRFCRTERILTYYGSWFSSPAERTAASQAAQNLIYLQDIFGELYGPAFSAKDQCDRFGGQPKGEYKAHLGPRLKERSQLDTQRAERVMNIMLATLSAAGLSANAALVSQSPSPSPYLSPSESDKVSRLLQDFCQRGVLWEPVDDKYERRDLIRQSVFEMSVEAKTLRETLPPQSNNVEPLMEIEIASKSLLQNNQIFASPAGPVDCTVRAALCAYRSSVAEARKKLEVNARVPTSCVKEFTCEPCTTVITPAILKDSLRRNISQTTVSRWGKSFHEWALWLELPDGLRDQVSSVNYTFPHGYLTKNDTLQANTNRSLGLAVWPANSCTNGGDTTALVTLKNGQPPQSFSFDLCLVPISPNRPQ